MQLPKWIDGFPGAITVSDAQGRIIYMNEKSCRTFQKDGGKDLLGTDLFSCHLGTSRQKLQDLFARQVVNVYTIEKNGLKKLVYQTPWYEKEKFMGYVELSLELPGTIPHYIR